MNLHTIRRIAALALCALLILSLPGCGMEAQELTEDIRGQSIDTSTQLSAGGEAVADFTLSLLKSTGASRESTLLSPLSALCALGMTASGAGGETLAQIESAVGMELTELNDYLYTFRMSLPEGDKKTGLSLANSLWLRDIFRVEDDFLRLCVNYYDAQVYTSAFDESLVDDVNRWVAKHTDGRIDQLLTEAPGQRTMLYLLNAATFTGAWETAYGQDDVYSGQFTALDGAKQEAAFMRSRETVYLSGYGAEGFLKHYSGGRYALVALLPEEGTTLGELLTSLTGEQLYTLLSDHRYATVEAALPRFSGETTLSLQTALEAMGVTDLFDISTADLRQMGSAPNDQLYVGDVLQKTYLQVDESGTKAAAATLMDTNDGAAPTPEDVKHITLDRPFLYMIVDTHVCLPIFAGTVTSLA